MLSFMSWFYRQVIITFNYGAHDWTKWDKMKLCKSQRQFQYFSCLRNNVRLVSSPWNPYFSLLINILWYYHICLCDTSFNKDETLENMNLTQNKRCLLKFVTHVSPWTPPKAKRCPAAAPSSFGHFIQSWMQPSRLHSILTYVAHLLHCNGQW